MISSALETDARSELKPLDTVDLVARYEAMTKERDEAKEESQRLAERNRKLVRENDELRRTGNVLSRESFDECCDVAWRSIGEHELRKLVLDALDDGGRRDLLRGDAVYVVVDLPRSFKASAGKGSEVLEVAASRVDAPDRSGVAYEITLG